MRTPGLVAFGISLAVVACGSSNGEGQSSAIVTAGAPSTLPGAGGAATLPLGGGATPATVTPGAPTGSAGAPATAGTVPTLGAGGTTTITGGAGAPGGGAPSGGMPTSGAPSGGSPSGGAPSGGAANGGASGAATVDPPNTVTLTTGQFQLQPGQEVYKCQNFDNPFMGKDTAVNRIVTDMAKGSHHLHVYNLTEGAGRALEDCSISDFHALVHAAGSPHAETDYPDGMATKIKGATGLRIQLHYLNTTTDVLPVGATLKLSPVADISTVSKWVAELYFNRVVLSVPPGMGQTVSTTCSIPSTYGQIGLVGGGTHMHQRGIREVATTSTGVQLADVTTWNEPPPIAYNPYVMMNPGDSITWTCTYNNDTSMTFTFGESVSTNEMCIYLARYYSTNSSDTQLACQAPSTNGGAAAPQPY